MVAAAEDAAGVGSVVALFVVEELRDTTTNARTRIPAKTVSTTRFDEFFPVVDLVVFDFEANDFEEAGAGVVLTVLTPGRSAPVGTGGTIKVEVDLLADFLADFFAAFLTVRLAALFFTVRFAITFFDDFFAVFLTAFFTAFLADFLADFFAVFLTATFYSLISISLNPIRKGYPRG